MTPPGSLDDLFGPMDNKPMSMSTEGIPSIVAVEAPIETEVDDDGGDDGSGGDDNDDDGFGDFDAAPSPAPSPNSRTCQTPPRERNTRGR